MNWRATEFGEDRVGIMAICKECYEDYSDKRKALGYDTCLECGDIAASKQALRKARCVAPAFNKGAYMYVSSKAMAKEVGRWTFLMLGTN